MKPGEIAWSAMAEKAGDARIVSSPRAADRVAAAAAWLEGIAPGSEVLVIASTRTAADDPVRRLAHSRGAVFGMHRLTLDRLVGLLASDHLLRFGLAPAAGLAMEAVTARVVHRLGPTGALAHFESVRDRPGFCGALSRTIAELRLNHVAPEALRAHGRAGECIAAVLGEFEAELVAAALADRALMLRAAIDALSGTALPRLAAIPTLMLDVAIESLLERDFVRALALRAPALLATVPARDMISESMLENALGVAASAPQCDSPPCSLRHLQDYLFADGAPPPAPLDDTVTLSSAPGEMHECIEIARRIHLEARRGVPFDRVAILCHQGGRYGQYLEEALDRAGIPAYFATGTRRPEPGGRALLALLACAAEDLSARRFAEYLSLAQVPDPDSHEGQRFVAPETELASAALAADLELPPALSEAEPAGLDPTPIIEGTLRAPWRWEKLLVEAAVIGRPERWERRLAGLGGELRRKRDECAPEEEHRIRAIDRALLDLSHLSRVALPLIQRLANRPRAALWSEWLGYLRALTEAAVRDAEPVLAALTELEPMGPVGPVDLDEVRIVLGERLGHLEMRPARRRYGAVFVAPPAHARGMSFDVVVVPGLAERLFPRKLTEDPILADTVRAAISPALKRQQDRVAAERLALRIAAGAAEKRAVFSYPRVDLDQGRPRVPSFYALELLRAAEGSLPGFGELARRAACEQGARLAWPAPHDPACAIDDAEFDLAILDKLVSLDPEATRGAAHYLLGANEHLARALRARARKWLRRWTAADGLVEAPAEALAALARHGLRARSYSPTALQHFAACPYRFFLHAVLRLEPREEALALEVLDPLTRGALTHEIQFELLTRLRAEDALPVTPANLERAYRRLEEIVEEAAARWRDELAPAIERVWDDGIDAIRADLREWLRRAAHDPEGWRPEKFELAFGLRDRPRADPASTEQGVALDEGLMLRGSIDLIERAPDGRLRATDHKTGKIRAANDFIIGGGKVLQPVLYGLAAEKVLHEPVTAGRLYYCTAAGGYQERVVELDARARTAAAKFAATLDAALNEGFLPAAPGPNECEWCDYRRVCGPYEELRAAFKPAARLRPVRELRESR